jgi:hypothetical protein
VVLSAIACFSGLGSCTYGGEDDPGLAGRSIDEEFRLIATDPAAGRIDVPPGWHIELRFDGPPDPDTAIPANVRVFAGLIEITGEIMLDLLDQLVRFIPSSPLRPRLRHQVYVHRSLRGLNGVQLADTVVFNFTTSDDTATPPRTPRPQVPGSQVQAEVFNRCSSCHRPPDPPARVDLSSLGDAVGTLRGVPSSYGSRLRVAPGDHTRSYLMMKLLGVGGFVGFRMPATGPPLTRKELRLVASWIDGGARP